MSMTVTQKQFRLRKLKLERRREIGELSEWEYRYLIAGLRACMVQGKLAADPPAA